MDTLYCLECNRPRENTEAGYREWFRYWRYEGEGRYRCPECLRKPQHQFCCEKGTSIPCVCHKAWKCPDHGTHHVGSHD